MWIKICGLNDPATAREIVKLRPDAIGVNFFEGSVRHVSPKLACEIRDVVPSSIDVIGVFVDATPDFVRRTVAECRLDGVQLHSTGDDDAFSELGDLSVRQKTASPSGERPSASRIRAFSVQSNAVDLGALESYLEAHSHQIHRPDACLVDAHLEGQFGGTGQQAPWTLVRRYYQVDRWPPLILAGGLNGANVAEAIRVVQPWGVDVASGVESSPGVKDCGLVARFIDEARRAFARLKQK